MDFLRLMAKNAARNRRRTLLTLLSVAASVFLLVILRTFLLELEWSSLLSDQSALRLVTRHATSMDVPLPLSVGQRIVQVPGVEQLTSDQVVFGYYQDPSNPVGVSAIDPQNVLRVFTEYHTSPAELEVFQKDRMGALVSVKLMHRFGWRVGDHITIMGMLFPFDIELVVRGAIEGPNQTAVLMHYDYFNELIRAHMPRRADKVTGFLIKVRRAEDVPRVAAAIDEMFRNSDTPTRTETEKSFLLSFTSMLGNLRLFLTLIGTAVIFAILLVTMNTMAMSVRERSAEVAVLKTLGFSPATVLALFVGESIMIALPGGVLGVLGAKLVFSAIDIYQLTYGVIQYFNITPATILLALGASTAIGALSAAWPAWRAVNASIAVALRQVG